MVSKDPIIITDHNNKQDQIIITNSPSQDQTMAVSDQEDSTLEAVGADSDLVVLLAAAEE